MAQTTTTTTTSTITSADKMPVVAIDGEKFLFFSTYIYIHICIYRLTDEGIQKKRMENIVLLLHRLSLLIYPLHLSFFFP